MHRTRVSRTVVILIALVFSGPAAAQFQYLPKAPPYPYYGPYETREGVLAAAQAQSDALYAHIDDWFQRGAPANEPIPDALLPDGRQRTIVNYYLVREQDIDPATQWAERLADYTPIDFNDTRGYFPDPHVTYLVLPNMLLPFGSKAIFEGEFPHARYFSLQPTAAFSPDTYRYNGFGMGEVAFLDADISPLPGNVNPFKPGVDRNATNRGYRVECTAAIGNPVDLDPSAWTPPLYRQATNHRYCSGLVFRGPWGDPAWVAQDNTQSGDAFGMFGPGEVWVRYYAPDDDLVPYAGVDYPKVTYQLPDGRRFFINADFSGFENNANRHGPLAVGQAPSEPPADSIGLGWLRQTDIFLAITNGLGRSIGWLLGGDEPTKQYLRDLAKGVTAKGEAQAPPNNLAAHATAAWNVEYFLQGTCLGADKAYVVRGKVPTFPRTRGGQSPMKSAEVRYWSITTYSSNADYDNPNYIPGQVVTSVMDEELVLSPDNDYVLVYSRPEDRPANATAANGVTWKDWGPETCNGLTMRWLAIGPEWSFAKTPDSQNVGLWETDWSASSFDHTRVGRNDRNGVMARYQPIVGLMTQAEFEALGASIDPSDIPAR